MESHMPSQSDSLCCKTNAQTCCSMQDDSQSGPASAPSALSTCQKELSEVKERLLRISADMDNFKRRAEKERTAWVHASQADLLKELLPVVDDLDRALLELQRKEQHPDLKSWLMGIEMIAKSFHKFLQQQGITEITERNQFDPSLHEAIASLEIPDKKSGDIVEVFQKGYLFKGELLRPAKVSVVK